MTCSWEELTISREIRKSIIQKKEFHILKRSSELGSHASYIIGLFYWNWTFVESDFKHSTFYCEQSASQGNSYSKVRFGICYRHVYGVECDKINLLFATPSKSKITKWNTQFIHKYKFLINNIFQNKTKWINKIIHNFLIIGVKVIKNKTTVKTIVEISLIT